ncbi:molybdopterin molybdotransferase MoeA [Bacillus xiapuensis]|uniref:molybdopterin molybdotransferase MoeA n=1 Tax=Bacillus xiapuensis TaxID=2014075 RepID=UPI000C240DFB|nr:gephyrin-like molybdotransferase Glp [Bacillus xiapuensis]
MVEKRKPIPVRDAIEAIMTRVKPLRAETVSLEESYGRILAEPIIATEDVPAFTRSPYDGFAIRAEDSEGASGEYRKQFTVIDHIGAGEVCRKPLAKGEAVRIMTGAPLPDDANAVVMLEQTVESGNTFTVRKAFHANENVSMRGEEAKKGEVLLDAGHFIHPGVIALLATFGYDRVKVSAKPLVGILATGSELVDVSQPLEPGKIRNSNGPMIAAQLKRIGVESRSYGMKEDDLEACLQIVKTALEEADCLITTGGVSVGDFDYLPEIYKRLGAEVLFNKVAMRPGSVTTVTHADGKLLFGLSGNPSACFSGFELFARPALLKMMGSRKPFLPYAKAVLAEDFTKANPFTRFVRAVYQETPEGAKVAPAGFNKSSAVSSIAKGNAMIVLPGGTRGFQAGDEVDVLLLGLDEGAENWMI